MPGFDGFPGGPPQPQGHGSPMRGGGMRGGGMRGGGGMGRGGGRGRGGRGGGGGGRGGGGGGIRFGSPQRGGGRGPMRGGGGGRGGGFDGFRENRCVWCGHATLVYGGSAHVLTVSYCLLFCSSSLLTPSSLPCPLFLCVGGVMAGDKVHHQTACESARHLSQREE